MSKIKIITDSSITIAPELLESLDISVVSLSFMIDGVVYQDEEVSGYDFMNMMAQAKTLPKTSQPPIGKFVEVYQANVDSGYEIISIHISHALSGTVEAARQASKLVDGNITVIDSGFTDQALAFQVISAAKLVQEGKDIADILDKLAAIKQRTRLFIGISNLDNLVKGGRISRLTGVVSSFLNVKIVMEFKDGKLIPISKGRGVKTFNKWFADWQNSVDFSQITHLGISHADGLALAENFRESLSDKVNFEIPVLTTGSTIATHTGAGAWSIMYD
ncbi:MAG: DegV family protein [Streptococcaceae bacterium]|jgi:DegV family protein with EDD domain|nr:DegV family protein [Streptococcaceae bacterium]